MNLLCHILTREQLFDDKEHSWLQASESTVSSGISSDTHKLDPVSPTCDIHTVASLAASAGERYLVIVLGNRRWHKQLCFLLSYSRHPTKVVPQSLSLCTIMLGAADSFHLVSFCYVVSQSCILLHIAHPLSMMLFLPLLLWFSIRFGGSDKDIPLRDEPNHHLLLVL